MRSEGVSSLLWFVQVCCLTFCLVALVTDLRGTLRVVSHLMF